MKLDQSRLEYYITPEQAAKQLGLDLDSIYQLADEGKLQAAVMTDGSIGISQSSVNNLLPKEALPEYQLNAELKGVPISINEAGRKYKLNTSTLTRWMQRGLIHQLGIIHYQFEAIHPFPDGNGRLGRLLISILLCAWNLLPQPLLYLSAFFETNRPDYYANLRGVSEKGNWNSWLSFFLNGVSSQAIDAAARVKRINDLRENYRQRFQQGRSAARLLQVVDLLFARPLISVRTVEEELALPYPTAERYIDELVKQGILEGTGKARNRVFRANEILQVIEKSG